MTMRERLARALYEADRVAADPGYARTDWEPGRWDSLSPRRKQHPWLIFADAILAALEEPTPEMVEAGQFQAYAIRRVNWEPGTGRPIVSEVVPEKAVLDIWRAMVRKAREG